MITFKSLLEAVASPTYHNQKLMSKRSDSEKRALHSQFRQLNRTDDAAANSNPRPLTPQDIANIEKWAKSRSNDPGFATQVDAAKYLIAKYRQNNKPKPVK